jgi:hypothetical protein
MVAGKRQRRMARKDALKLTQVPLPKVLAVAYLPSYVEDVVNGRFTFLHSTNLLCDSSSRILRGVG